VRLDRKVVGQEIAEISKKPVVFGQKIYSLGHPCGLSMKYSPYGKVLRIKKAYFTSEIDLYSGNSGSPVFDAVNHQMIGIVSGSDPVDFDWNEKYCGFHSVTYPHKEFNSNGGRIIKVTEFLDFLNTN
jgi:V8-like Glu-specific endopeptidase